MNVHSAAVLKARLPPASPSLAFTMKIRARVVLLAAFSLAVGAAIFFAAQQRRGEKPAAAQKKSAPPETLAAPGVSGSPASVAPTAAGSAPPAIAKGTPAAPPAAVAAVPSPAPVPAMPAPTPEPVASSTGDVASGDASMVASVTDAQGAVRELTPDNLGFFPRVYIEPRQVVPVRVNFADGRRDEVAVVRVEDGGRLEGNAPAKTFNLDDKGSIGFAFQANADPGVYHVVVHRGGDERVLDFWVGPRMPAANR